MPIINISYPKFRAYDSNNVPLASGKLFVYQAGTSTDLINYTDADKGGQNTQPIILDANGECDLWIEASAKLVLQDSAGTPVWTIDDIQPNIVRTDNARFNRQENGSFEEDSNGDGIPDSWDVSLYTDGIQTLDSTTATHGGQAIKFTSGGSGGGSITSSNFLEIEAGAVLNASFSLKSSNATVRNVVSIKWYDLNQVFISTSVLYDEATNNPTSFLKNEYRVETPATATYCKAEIIGVHETGGTITSGESTWVDNFKLVEEARNVFEDHNGYRLVLSAPFLTLQLVTNNFMHINGEILYLEGSPPILATTGLLVDTVYFIYAYKIDSTTIALEASTTSQATTTINNVTYVYKSGDLSRRFMGVARTENNATVPQWYDNLGSASSVARQNTIGVISASHKQIKVFRLTDIDLSGTGSSGNSTELNFLTLNSFPKGRFSWSHNTSGAAGTYTYSIQIHVDGSNSGVGCINTAVASTTTYQSSSGTGRLFTSGPAINRTIKLNWHTWPASPTITVANPAATADSADSANYLEIEVLG